MLDKEIFNFRYVIINRQLSQIKKEIGTVKTKNCKRQKDMNNWITDGGNKIEIIPNCKISISNISK